MKNLVINSLVVVAMSVFIWSCNTAEQDVEPIVSATSNPSVTITARQSVTSVVEGDTLWFDIVADNMIDGDVDFGPVFTEGSTADADDIEVIGGTLSAYSLETQVGVVILSDHLVEMGETMKFEVSYGVDDAHSWRLSPNSVFEMVSVSVTSIEYDLDWSEGMYDGEDMCEWDIDLDTYVANADFSAYSFAGATGACPVEHQDLVGLPDDTYDIYVDYWDGGIPAGEALDIPYTLYFSYAAGSQPFMITGTFNSDDIGASVIVGQIVISNGTYTVLDGNGATVGTM
jgi:hypothetical protein